MGCNIPINNKYTILHALFINKRFSKKKNRNKFFDMVNIGIHTWISLRIKRKIFPCSNIAVAAVVAVELGVGRLSMK